MAVALAKYLPQTTDPCGKVAYGIPVQSNESQIVGRVDWIINPKHSFYGRYFVDNYTLKAFFDPHDILVTSVTGNVERATTFVLGDTYTLSPSTVNSFHATVGRRSNNRGPNADGINMATLGATNLYQGTSDFLQVAVNNGGFAVGCGTCALGRFPVTSFQYADDVDILRGKHQIAFGVDYIRTRQIQENHYNDDGVLHLLRPVQQRSAAGFPHGQDEYLQSERPAAQRSSPERGRALRAGHLPCLSRAGN